VLRHLWTNEPAPPAWIDYVLCSKFHKLPSELENESYLKMLDLMTCMAVEQKVERARTRQLS
jgi:hypothetical protein